MSSKIARLVPYLCLIFFLCLSLTYARRIKRIVNGTPVTCGTQPRAASLRNSTTDQHLCGAIIVSPDFTLTAAHCLLGTPDQYYLQLRNFCIGENETYPNASIVDMVIHEEYDRYTRAHDLALLRLAFGSVDVTWLNNETMLPASSFGLMTSQCLIYGYGSMDPNSEDTSDTLLVGRVQTVSLDECIERLGPYVAPEYDSGMMCALGDNADACQGDSGGPMICEGPIVQGISSYGQSCGVDGLPGVYTSIGAHLSWIRNEMNKGAGNSTAL